MTILFIYGTLKRGFHNHCLLDGQTFISVAFTKSIYRMYDYGHFPVMVVDMDGVNIHGELWEVNDFCLKQLDRLEGIPHFYDRLPVELLASLRCTGRHRRPKAKVHNIKAETYIWQGEVVGLEDCGHKWIKKARK